MGLDGPLDDPLLQSLNEYESFIVRSETFEEESWSSWVFKQMKLIFKIIATVGIPLGIVSILFATRHDQGDTEFLHEESIDVPGRVFYPKEYAPECDIHSDRFFLGNHEKLVGTGKIIAERFSWVSMFFFLSYLAKAVAGLLSPALPLLPDASEFVPDPSDTRICMRTHPKSGFIRLGNVVPDFNDFTNRVVERDYTWTNSKRWRNSEELQSLSNLAERIAEEAPIRPQAARYNPIEAINLLLDQPMEVVGKFNTPWKYRFGLCLFYVQAALAFCDLAKAGYFSYPANYRIITNHQLWKRWVILSFRIDIMAVMLFQCIQAYVNIRNVRRFYEKDVQYQFKTILYCLLLFIAAMPTILVQGAGLSVVIALTSMCYFVLRHSKLFKKVIALSFWVVLLVLMYCVNGFFGHKSADTRLCTNASIVVWGGEDYHMIFGLPLIGYTITASVATFVLLYFFAWITELSPLSAESWYRAWLLRPGTAERESEEGNNEAKDMEKGNDDESYIYEFLETSNVLPKLEEMLEKRKSLDELKIASTAELRARLNELQDSWAKLESKNAANPRISKSKITLRPIMVKYKEDLVNELNDRKGGDVELKSILDRIGDLKQQLQEKETLIKKLQGQNTEVEASNSDLKKEKEKLLEQLQEAERQAEKRQMEVDKAENEKNKKYLEEVAKAAKERDEVQSLTKQNNEMRVELGNLWKRLDALESEKREKNKKYLEEVAKAAKERDEVQRLTKQNMEMYIRTKALESEKRDHSVDLKKGAMVYIRTKGGHYLARQPCGTYCAAATSEGWSHEKQKAKFFLKLETCEDSGSGTAHGHKRIRIMYADETDYLEEYKYLYAAATGSAKYATSEPANSKQFWKLTVDGNTGLNYNEEVEFFDCYADSMLCVNRLGKGSCNYKGGKGKIWVECKYLKNCTKNDLYKFVVERVV